VPLVAIAIWALVLFALEAVLLGVGALGILGLQPG
jgi:hypothetical protein